jgi:DNA-binding NarL/FixJ family response regulator
MTPPFRSRILLLTGNAVLSEGLRSILLSSEFELIGTCADTDSLARRISASRVDIVLMDTAHGVTLASLNQLKGSAHDAQLVLWGNGISPEFSFQAMEAGVRGVIPQDFRVDELLSALHDIRGGKLWFSKDLMSNMLCARRTHLTGREGDLVALLAQGKKNKEIAYLLGIREGTVKVYLSRLFQKLGVDDRFQLALYALRNVVSGDAPVAGRGPGPAGIGPAPVAPPRIHSFAIPVPAGMPVRPPVPPTAPYRIPYRNR